MTINIIDKTASRKRMPVPVIPTGAIFYGRIASPGGATRDRDLYLRIYGGFVSLSKPKHTWTGPSAKRLTIDEYQPVKHRLVIEGPEKPRVAALTEQGFKEFDPPRP